MKLFIANVCIALIPVLVGCGGGGGGSDIPMGAVPIDPPPVAVGCETGTQAQPSSNSVVPVGIYTGTFVDCVSGATYYPIVLVDRDGSFRVVWPPRGHSTQTDSVLLSGTLQLADGRVVGNGRRFTASGVTSELWLEGAAPGPQHFTGRWGDGSGPYGYFQLEYSAGTYERRDAGQLLYASPELVGYDYDASVNIAWTVATDGRLEGIDTGGCIYAGQATADVAGYNLFKLALTVTNCDRAGSYAGLATILMWGDDTFQNPEWRLLIDDGEASVINVSLAPSYTSAQGVRDRTAAVAGIWEGEGLDGRGITALWLESGAYYLMYSASGDASVPAGFVYGRGNLSAYQFVSEHARNFSYEGAGVAPVWLLADTVLQESMTGGMTYVVAPEYRQEFTLAFSQRRNPDTAHMPVAGSYDGQLYGVDGAAPFSLRIDDTGVAAATTGDGCQLTGSLRRSTSGHAYTIELKFGATPCAFPGQAFAGAGTYDPNRNLLQLALVDEAGTQSLVVTGAREGGFDSDGDGVADSDDTDDDNDGAWDDYDKCPFDPALVCPDTVFADGRTWLQPRLLRNLSWQEINAVCPAGNAGVCNGNLKGRDMTGWTWASSDQVRALFDYYGFHTVPAQLATDAGYTPGILAVGPFADRMWWSDTGWLPTGALCPWDTCIYYFAGFNRDAFGTGPVPRGPAWLLFDAPFYTLGWSASLSLPSGVTGWASPGGLGNQPFEDAPLSPDTGYEAIGGWFYRAP